MTTAVDDTHDPALESFVASANDPATDFPLQNLPLGRFRRGSGEEWQIGAAIGDQVLPLRESGFVANDDMNRLMADDTAARRSLRQALSKALRSDSPRAAELRRRLVAQADIELGLPCRIGDYTDFYTGIHHATNVGKLFRPDNPLLPNYKWVPIGYHGRASSIVVSGHPIRRPHGQSKDADAATPSFGPTRRLDYELELGAFIGEGNALGEPIAIDGAASHVFGFVLFNDWTARDVQAWEYQPLGPFLSKNFASTVSPWIVTLEALAPFRAPFVRPAGDPAPLPYLDSAVDRAMGAFDITLEVWLQTAAMRDTGVPATRLMSSNFRDSYWTLAQLVAHHTITGCNLQPGDLLGTGTQSGPGPGQGGSMLELSNGGRAPLRLPNGETRTFLQDGDTVILRGYCERPGARRIGFGGCAGTVTPA
ncbi:MAG TPA: fumarylacetoacetase [Casimicrobiaceae bacterium]